MCLAIDMFVSGFDSCFGFCFFGGLSLFRMLWPTWKNNALWIRLRLHLWIHHVGPWPFQRPVKKKNNVLYILRCFPHPPFRNLLRQILRPEQNEWRRWIRWQKRQSATCLFPQICHMQSVSANMHRLVGLSIGMQTLVWLQSTKWRLTPKGFLFDLIEIHLSSGMVFENTCANQKNKTYHKPAVPRFQMLKAWMINPDLSSIDVEEKYQRYADEQRTDRYITVTESHIGH